MINWNLSITAVKTGKDAPSVQKYFVWKLWKQEILEKKSKSNLAIKPELLQSVIQLEKGSFQKSDYVNLVCIYVFT